MDYREKTQTENQQLFDGIIDVILFDKVEGVQLKSSFVYWIRKHSSWLKIFLGPIKMFSDPRQETKTNK